MIEEFLNKSSSNEELQTSNLDSETLIEVGNFLGMNLIKGTNIISTIFNSSINLPINIYNIFRKIRKMKAYKPKHKIFNHEIKLNFGPFEFMKKKFLQYQINKHLNKIRNQDKAVSSFGTDNIPNTHL